MHLLRLLFLALLALLASAGIRAEDKPLSFGVLNQQSPALTAERWNPILHYLAGKTGQPLQLRMGKTVQETDAMMGRGEFDFMFTNHNFQSEYLGVGYRTIARWAGEPIHGVIAVADDGPPRHLNELAGQAVAFPSNDAFVAYAVPVVMLAKARVKVREVFAGNQEGALAQLKAHRVEAAAVNSRFLEQYMEREKVRFRVIWQSEAYPDLAVIVHPRMSREVVDKVRAALLGMKHDPAAAEILTRAKSKGFDAAGDKDYEGVRQIYKASGQ
jgi:phosphonate transport system substrate-binding protein